MQISTEEAETLLKADIASFESAVDKSLNGIDLTDNQFSALVSLCYNCGMAPLRSDNTIRRTLDDGDYDGAANGFLLWNKAGGRVLKGLVRRREAERSLFLRESIRHPPLAPERADAIRLIFEATHDTYLKKSTQSQSWLHPDEKRFIQAGELLAGELRGALDAGHYKIYVETNGEEWYVFHGHFQILNVVAIAT